MLLSDDSHCVWFQALKKSARNSRAWPSFRKSNGNRLAVAMFQLLIPGSVNAPNAELPHTPNAGSEKHDVLYHWSCVCTFAPEFGLHVEIPERTCIRSSSGTTR